MAAKKVAEKVAAAEIIEKANPRYRGGGEDSIVERRGGRVFSESLEEKRWGFKLE